MSGIPYDWNEVNIPASSPRALFQETAVWNNQVLRMKSGKGYPKGFPACYVEAQTQNSVQFLEGLTCDDKLWRFHIVDVELDAIDGTMDQNLTVFGYRDRLKDSMTGFTPPNCSMLSYVDERQDYDHDDVYHYVVEFKSCFTDTKGSYLDPDQSKVLFKEPPTDLELEIGFAEPPAPPVEPLALYIWMECPIRGKVVLDPNPEATQTLDNGVVIPLEYAPTDPIYDDEDNIIGYRKLTIPYLITTPGISVLVPFLIDDSIIMNMPYDILSGTFNAEANGGFIIGNEIAFNANVPRGVEQ